MSSSKGDTYRSLANVMGPVDLGDDRPGWAKEYAVGDRIAVRHPVTAKPVTAPVAGFSIKEEYRGLPVIIPPPELANGYDEGVQSIAIRKRDHIAAGPQSICDEE